MSSDLEVLESHSNTQLDADVQEYIALRPLESLKVSYSSYIDGETDEVIYVATVFKKD